MSGSANRPRVLSVPYSATPDVASCAAIPHPRSTTQMMPRFQGPKGMLAPIPATISHAWFALSGGSPGTTTANNSPLTNQPTRAISVMTTICGTVKAASVAATSR